VVGRKAAGVAGYNYTDALTKAGAAGKTWTREELDVFLRDPSKDVPGTAMPIGIADAKARAAVIDYLASQSGKATAPLSRGSRNRPAPKSRRLDLDDKPGDLHHLTADKLAAPFASESAGNGPKVAPRPDGAMPAVPKGFKVVIVFAGDTGKARLALRAPNGDIILSEASKGQVSILRRAGGDKADTASVFATGLSRPYGMALWPSGANPKYLYVANVNSWCASRTRPAT
jgi:glucose/arabinose dehydrogenase